MEPLSAGGIAWIGAPPWLAAAALYLLTGLGVALLLARQGLPLGTVLGACIAWPLLLGLIGARARPAAGGPLARRITEAFQTLEEVLGEHHDAPLPGELDALRAALLAADQRLAVADRILEDPRLATGGGAVAEDLSTLQAARGRAAAELEDVLGGVMRLRIQVGLLALTEIGDEGARAVQQHLRQLHARVRAIEELASLSPPPLA